MSSYDFWYNDSELFFCYMRAYEQQQKIQDSNNHALGLYIELAFQQVINNAFSKSSQSIYPKEPFLSRANTSGMASRNEMETRIVDKINQINKLRKK